DFSVFILSLLQAISNPIVGLCYSLAFAFDKNTLRELTCTNLRMHIKSWFVKSNQPQIFEASPTTEMPAAEYALYSDRHKLISPDNSNINKPI
ncbi:hypothetical protein, partial [Salmonella sp. s51228]|uniref:hypothetical protein n=1 Tax=Salmonella sp. s51228 TaxID=3159652 RepID=UPI0039801238